MKQVKMPKLSVKERKKNFEEVNLGYNIKQALQEAERCLQCKVPNCVKACPIHNPIPEFIKLIKEKKFDDGLALLKKNNLFCAVTGRVCPQFCQQKCVKGIKEESIAIRNLERFLADNGKVQTEEKKELNGKKVAVVGSGPAGLSCARELALAGFKVNVFEKLEKCGGVLRFGIPSYRLPKKVLKEVEDELTCLGIEFQFSFLVGKNNTLDELAKEFDFVVIATGAWKPKKIRVKGENLKGVYYANEFLAFLPEKSFSGKKILVIGGGNVAVDAARTALRLGAKPTIVYRRTEKQMPAIKEDVEMAKEEGIDFKFLLSPVEVLGKEKVEGMRFQKTEVDEQGNFKKVEEFVELKTDIVLVGVSQTPSEEVAKDSSLRLDEKWQCIVVDENLKSSMENVFAVGDCTTGPKTVAEAIASGKKVAEEIKQKNNLSR